MIPQVLEAIEAAFHPAKMEPHLTDHDGRILGSVTVVGSDIFDRLDDLRRQQLLWRHLRELLGAQAICVGPVVLEPTRRG